MVKFTVQENVLRKLSPNAETVKSSAGKVRIKLKMLFIAVKHVPKKASSRHVGRVQFL